MSKRIKHSKMVMIMIITMISVICFAVFTYSETTIFASGTADGSIKLQMYNAVKTESSNTINPFFKLINTGEDDINLSDVKILYFYTIDGEKEQSFWCDWCSAGSSTVKGIFNKISDSASDEKYYLEISFSNEAGKLAPDESIELQIRFAKNDWSNYIQSNDYSFSTAANYIDWDKSVLYLGNQRVWGNNPYLSEEPDLQVPDDDVPDQGDDGTEQGSDESDEGSSLPEETATTPGAVTVRLEMVNSNIKDITNTISPNFKLHNTGETSINLEDLKIRYFYTINGEAEQNFWCDWSDVGSSNVTNSFTRMPTAMIGADYYIDIEFSQSAGVLNPESSIELKNRIAKTDWSDYDQSDDFSFNNMGKKYSDWTKAAVYLNDTLIWGAEPAEIAPVIPSVISVRLEVDITKEKDKTNTLFPRYILVNTGNTDVDLKDVKIRYYYTIDGKQGQNYWCDWSSAGTANITGRFVQLEVPFDKADYFCETAFKDGSGVLKPGKSVEIHSRIAKINWSDYSQSNDYSYSGNKKYTVWDKVSVLIGDELFWGDSVLFGKPSGITAESYENSIRLSWDAVEGAIAYEIEQNNQIIGTATDTRFEHEGLNAGTIYDYRIRAKSSTLSGSWSEKIFVLTLSSAPQEIISSSNENEILVSWNASVGADTYDIELDGAVIENVTSPYVNGGFSSGTKHIYRFRANNSSGTGNWSREFEIWTLPDKVNDSKLFPTEDQITVEWDHVQGATGYDLELNGVQTDNVSNPYIVIGLEPGHEYALRLRAKNNSGAGKWNEAQTIWTLPDAPMGITYSATETQISLLWDEVTSAASYDIEADGQIIQDIGSGYTHLDLDPGTLHSYRIRAKNSSGYGKWSSDIYVWTLPPEIAGIQTFATQDVIAVSWDETQGASRYDIEFDGQLFECISSSFSMAELLPGTEHSFKIRAVNDSGAGQWCEPIIYWTVPDIVGNVSDEATTTEIVVLWEKVTGATGYDIEVDGQMLEDHNSPFTHMELTAGSRHIYRIRAKNSSGAGLWSESISVWTLPDKAEGLTLHPAETEIMVEWTPVTGASGYDLEADGILIQDVEQPYISAGLLPGTNHEYRVRAKNSSGAGEWSTPAGTRTIPGIVNNLKSKAEENKIAIDCEPVEGADSYDIEADGIVIENVVFPYECRDLLPGTEHRYRVRAVNSSGKGRWSDEAIVWTLPSTPANIEQTAEDTFITIQWDNVTGAVSYDIEADGEITEDVSNPYVHSGLMPGTAYVYRVRARNSSGVGKWSEEYTKWTLPGIVTNIEPSASQQDITLAWEQVTGAEGYDISMDGVLFEDVSSPYTFEGLLPGTMHKFSLRAVNSSGKGKWNEEVIVWALPDIPQNVLAAAATDSIALIWDNTAGATSYEVEILNTPVNTGGIEAYTHYGLNSNTQYTYRVRAMNSSGAGEWSDIIAKTTLPAVPGVISTYVTDKSVRLEWNDISGATGYDVEADGIIIPDIGESFYIQTNLISDTPHIYRVRSKRGEETGNWSNEVHVTTLLPAPKDFESISSTDKIEIMWNGIENASGYEIEADGKLLENGTQTSFTHSSLKADTEHIYRVRAYKEDVPGEWSNYIHIYTQLNAPKNVILEVRSTVITASWDILPGASGYDVEFDGDIIDNGLCGIYTYSGLEPLTEHQIRVRAKSNNGSGAWSEYISGVTLIETPSGVSTVQQSDRINISWNPVRGAAGYELVFDGNPVNVGNQNEYVQSDLEPDTIHYFKIRARCGEIYGEWTETFSCKTLIGIPTNLEFSAESSKITINWDEVAGAESYDIETDDSLIEGIVNLFFIHSRLEPDATYQYRIRARNASETGEWSDPVTVRTTIGVPENIKAQASTSDITLNWEAVNGAISYDLEVDGEVIGDIVLNSYTHDGLKSNTRHTYRIRSKNDTSVSEWSSLIIQNTVPEITIPLKMDNMFNFVIVVPPSADGADQTVIVEYNPEELDVFDLCAVTAKPETETGQIEGTDIYVKGFSPGKIVYSITGSDKTTVNITKYISKIAGNSKVTYTIK